MAFLFVLLSLLSYLFSFLLFTPGRLFQIKDKREERKDEVPPLAAYRAKRIAVASRLAAKPLLNPSALADFTTFLSSLLSLN